MNIQDELVKASLKTSSAMDPLLGRALNMFLGAILIAVIWVVEFVAIMALGQMVADLASPDDSFPYLLSYALLLIFIGLSVLVSLGMCLQQSDDLRLTLLAACRWSAPGMIVGLVKWCIRRTLAR
ncbi:hypothetical protein A8950_2721 [Dongia mobilis]|uniref:Uncharacterized protein n=1 Tax=Dongia mobilis TaxID=578943 RepID=A0A4R6WJZ4_9PROT|nr:hypothetical protein [Dongia mobilis]TDQ80853.1 hypothetical protein A8950_2721 [Dongia mobilis]